ncbi:MAG: TMEM175 family protein, partial [Rhodoglobus sp.]
MTDVRSRYRRVFIEGSNTDRLVFFSDAVFAIALTLLVIDLKVPTDGSGTAWEVITSQIPDLFAYALSFAIVSINWVAHHRLFRVITAHDGPLMLVDLVLLFVVAFVPFPTSLLSEYGDEAAAVVLYAFVVGLLGVLQFALWFWAWRHGLVGEQVDLELYRYYRSRQLATPAIFWLSIPLALFVRADWAMYFWLTLI